MASIYNLYWFPGKIEGGLPRFGPPPFSTVVANETLPFDKMLGVIGPEGVVIPLIAILETIAIAKAFGKIYFTHF